MRRGRARAVDAMRCEAMRSARRTAASLSGCPSDPPASAHGFAHVRPAGISRRARGAQQVHSARRAAPDAQRQAQHARPAPAPLHSRSPAGQVRGMTAGVRSRSVHRAGAVPASALPWLHRGKQAPRESAGSGGRHADRRGACAEPVRADALATRPCGSATRTWLHRDSRHPAGGALRDRAAEPVTEGSSFRSKTTSFRSERLVFLGVPPAVTSIHLDPTPP